MFNCWCSLKDEIADWFIISAVLLMYTNCDRSCYVVHIDKTLLFF